MKLITDKRFNNLKKVVSYHNVFILNQSTLLKPMDHDDIPFIKDLMKLKIDKLGLPLDIYKTIISSDYLYSIPYFKFFDTLDNFYLYERNFSDKEILIFFKSLIKKIEEMHKNGLSSGDIWTDNILIDENLDYRFVDFDYATTNNFLGRMVSYGPIFLKNYNKSSLDSNYSIEQQVQLSDKMSLWNMILNCMLTGAFEATRELEIPSEFSSLGLPKSIEKKLKPIFELEELVNVDDYFLEEIDTLIKTDYKLPYRKKK